MKRRQLSKVWGESTADSGSGTYQGPEIGRNLNQNMLSVAGAVKGGERSVVSLSGYVGPGQV